MCVCPLAKMVSLSSGCPPDDDDDARRRKNRIRTCAYGGDGEFDCVMNVYMFAFKIVKVNLAVVHAWDSNRNVINGFNLARSKLSRVNFHATRKVSTSRRGPWKSSRKASCPCFFSKTSKRRPWSSYLCEEKMFSFSELYFVFAPLVPMSAADVLLLVSFGCQGSICFPFTCTDYFY